MSSSSRARFRLGEFLDLAAELVRRRGDPAAERTAISRAFYAAFHKACDYFSAQGERLTLTGEDHGRVWDWFVRRGDAPSRQVGSAGRRLRDERRRADYDPTGNPSLSSDAEYAVRLARRVLSDLRVMR